MRKALSVVTSLLLLSAAALPGRAIETTREYSVQVSAKVQASPAQISLSWPQDAGAKPDSYTLFRKAPGASSWGKGVSLAATATSYVDKDVAAGRAYEYQIVKTAPHHSGYGYIYAGINVPLTEDRGKLLLVVDKTYAADLSGELARLQQDLVGDGWSVKRLEVNRNDSPASVKDRIKAQYHADPANVKAVFLFGHVPVAYSGDIVPDGHAPQHQGAWPCDGFYGDMDGTWTDESVNDTRASDARTRNVPGDGKYDQSSFPAPLKLMVGRVDLANMPGRKTQGGAATFPSELELLRNYLNKDHNFRAKEFDLPRRGIVGDYFGIRDGEAFAASGWRNLSSFFDANHIETLDDEGTWISTLSTNSCLWAYGCGPGSYTSIGGLGNSDSYHDGVTTEFVKNDVKAVFTLLFGSWLGDWDSEDNLQRAVLALPSYGLTCACSGRPHWFLQHMALGEPIGYSARLTQNNGPTGLYRNQLNNCASQTHIALMGDPTLRMHVVAPPSALASSTQEKGLRLDWLAANDSVVGYHVYRASNPEGPFSRLTASPVAATSFTDASPSAAPGTTYMVRAVKLETSASGTYYNASQGAFVTPSQGAPAAIATVDNNPVRAASPARATTGAPRIERTLLAPTGSAPSTNAAPRLTPTGASVVTNNVPWFDDALPPGGVGGADGGDAWSWVTSNPTPFSGTRTHQSSTGTGTHQHYFAWVTTPFPANTGDVLYAYVYLDPAHPPTEVMLQWYNGTWEHRAYWGANSIIYGKDGTVSRHYMGPLPAAGQWARLEVPASQVALEGSKLTGMAFAEYGGRATWDLAGKAALVFTNTPPVVTNTPPVVTNTPPPTTDTAASVIWVEDALPTGAVPGADGGDSWNWVSSNPTPFSGTLASQSSIGAGEHQHFFYNATATLPIASGDVLFANVYLDPANPPNEVALFWNDGTWSHGAYWGANNIGWGTNGTASRRYMGALPAAGQWVRLEVPASQVGLEGSKLNGMSFCQYNGRATWDSAGKGAAAVTPPATNPPSDGGTNKTVISSTTWVEDALPTGAVPGADGGDSWNWVSSNPTPFSGTLASQSSIGAGEHQHFFYNATATLPIASGDVLFANVYLDPANPPNEVALFWNDGTWSHGAYWGANNIGWGTNGTASRRYMGALPAAGQWVRLEVPASQVGLEGSKLNGMSFCQYNGRATWDSAGKGAAAVTPPATNPPSDGGTNKTVISSTTWVEDALPTGAVPGADGGDSWNWVSSNPTPFSGTLASQSSIGAGEHQHFFYNATATLPIASGDVLFANVYLDPANPPNEVALFWNDGTWSHGAYWGANNIGWGTNGTASRRYMGALPAAGQWVRLEVPASQVGLEGSKLNGMSFCQYNGRATWDSAGKAVVAITVDPPAGSTNNPPVTTTNTPPDTTTNTPPVTTTNTPPDTTTNTPPPVTTTNDPPATTTNTPPPVVTTNTPPVTTNTPPVSTNAVPGVSSIDYLNLELPKIGDNTLHVLTPNMLELKLINTEQSGASVVSQWNLVNANQFVAPPASDFAVTANGQPVAIAAIGFKRRPLSAPFAVYDLRIENSLYLQLAGAISDNQVIEVKNLSGNLWSGSMKFIATVDPLRYSPAIHVNQEGYVPNNPKKAMVGYYIGSLGEMNIPASSGFKIVDATTGASVFQGTLVQRADVGYTYSPTPYQKVYEADFTSFKTPGEYRLQVPGMGASVPFMIDDGAAMSFARAYALGLYHQRCGTNTAMPYTRFTHDTCHAAPASVPMPAASYPFTWNTIAGYANTINSDNPVQTAPRITSASAQLFPFVRQGTVDVSGGHHDAGDYSKYTENSAFLTHLLMFSADSLAGVGSLDNLGTPESGDGIGDVLQEAKWEADFLAKLQDTDGGFYFLVYPVNREYEAWVTPDHGDAQVVWPKTTSVTAAAVAALAQCGSSPAFKAAYPDTAALYLQKAKLGWQFLMNAIAKYGKNGAYQKITHYGDDFADNDEMAWAAVQMYLATGDQTIHQQLLSWFNPADPATWHWGWWHLSECYGHAIRSYAFGALSGRVSASQLDPTLLAKCQAEIAAAGDDALNWSKMSAYGTSFPDATKRVQAAGWYFSTDQAFDMAVAYQLNPKPEYITAMVANMNYEGGCNPVNVTFVSGLGWKRQRDMVSQWASADTRVLPPSGIPVGNFAANFGYLSTYGGALEALCFPSDSAGTAPYPFYDRWGDSWNVTAEFTISSSARCLGTVAFLAAQTSLKSQPWKAPSGAQIIVPASASPGTPVTVSLQVPGMDLSGARITWEARDQEPAFGQTFTFTPQNNGAQWIEAEAQWPDGRRAFAKATLNANSPNIVWVDDALPAGAVAGADGGDAWNWVSSNPAPHTGSLASQSVLAAGEHQHFFYNATATMVIGTGDVLYAWVYLDPANPPSEVALFWNDGTWNHGAYWGANSLSFGVDGTVSRHNMGPLPAVGQWVQLQVPASQVGLEGSTLNGMAFTLFGGRATWDTAGRLSQSN